jgi:hypothetical protein
MLFTVDTYRKCTAGCGRTIKKGETCLSYSIRTRYGTSNISICLDCMIKFTEELKDKNRYIDRRE